jgi:hypothetical protein
MFLPFFQPWKIFASIIRGRSLALLALAGFACATILSVASFAQQPSPNVNVLPAVPASNAQKVLPPPGTPPLIPPAFTLTDFLNGDGFLQRQVEPSIAASTYNPDHIVAVYGDYRTVQFPESTTGEVTTTGWMGISRSYDRGQTWFGALIPGFPGDPSPVGRSSPLYGLSGGSDAVVATTPAGHFYIGGLFFTPGGISNIGVVHYRDVPDTEGGDTIRYQSAFIVDKGSQAPMGNFNDKPGMASDIARGTTDPKVCGPAYIAYTIFNGGTTGSLFTSKLGFSRLKQGKCDNGWGNPQYLNKNYKQNQGAAVAVDPKLGTVYVVWRHLAVAGGDGFPDSILMVSSSDGGASFTSPVPITPTGWAPFDQLAISTANTSDPQDNLTFRSNAFPAIAVDGNSNVYVAAQEKIFGSSGYSEPRIVIRTMKAKSNTFTASYVSSIPVSPASPPSGGAQQVMPQLTFGAGMLKALWYDFRDQNMPSTNVAPGTWSISGIDRQAKTYVAEADVSGSFQNPSFGTPVVVTQYMLDPYKQGTASKVPGTDVPAVNRPNLPMYVNGTTPFTGDYVGIQVASPFVPTPGGPNAFRWATDPGDFAAGSAYAAWTDSRDVIFPSVGSGGTPNLIDFGGRGWSYYAPPGTGNLCYNEGSRNANVYFSEIKPGVIAGSPSPNKQLVTDSINGIGGKPIERDFPIYVQNPNPTTKFFVLSFASGSGLSVDGSFKQGTEEMPNNPFTSTTITVLPLSTVTATVYVLCPRCTSTTPFAPFSISVTETDSTFTTNLGLVQSVAFDSDPSAPLTNNIDTELHDVMVSPAQFSNPQYATPQYATPQYATAQFSNPQYATPQYATTPPPGDLLTPAGDFIWTVQDIGSSASAYVSLTNVATQSLGSGYTYQVIISRAYNFPAATNGCNSQSIPTDQIISIINNPNVNPQYATPQYATPQYATATYGDATFSAVPFTSSGADLTTKMPRQIDYVYVVLRVFRAGGGTTPLSPTEIQNFLNNISPTVYPQAAPVSATRGTTTLGLMFSPNPSQQGQQVTFTATITAVSNPAAMTPTGSVSFYDGAATNLLGSGTVGAVTPFQASFSTSSLSPGLHTIIAKYSGDPNFLSNSATLGQSVLFSSPTPTAAASSLSVLVSGTNVVSYVPKGHWINGLYPDPGATGVSVVNVEGSSVTPTLIPTTNVVNSCASNPATGQTVCTANNTDVYLLSSTMLSSTLTSGGSGTISFSGGSCTNCGVAMDAIHNKAVIGLSTSSTSSAPGFQFLDLGSSPSFETAFTSSSSQISEEPLLDPTRNLLLSAAENNNAENSNYEIVNVTTTTSPAFFDNTIGVGTNVYGLDSSGEDYSTGIALAAIEDHNTSPSSSSVYIADLTQSTFTAGSPGTWTTTGSQVQTLSEATLKFGASGIAVAQGTHIGVVTGEFGGDALTAIALPTTSGSGTPAIGDWVTCSIGSGFSMGLDPHTETAYQSPNSGHAIALLAGNGSSTIGGATNILAVVDLTKMLDPAIVPRTTGTGNGHGCASRTLSGTGVVTFVTVP